MQAAPATGRVTSITDCSSVASRIFGDGSRTQSQPRCRNLASIRGKRPRRWHWDNYWRLFSVIEAALPRELLEREVELISRRANEVVWSDAVHAKVHATDGFIDVNAAPEQSVFPFDARKTCAHSVETGFSFIHVVNRTIPRMNIIQRRDSGWVNWGTNGENEYPELPSGATIRAAYGQFDDWEAEANKMETPLAVAVGPLEWR